jgi:hypothetical protein
MTRNMRNRHFWELCYCVRCGRLNYIEPYRKTAKCKCSPQKTEHKGIPIKYQNAVGTLYDGPPRIEKNRGSSDSSREWAADEDNAAQNRSFNLASVLAVQVTELDSAPYLTC